MRYLISVVIVTVLIIVSRFSMTDTLQDITFDDAIDNSLLVKLLKTHVNKLTVEIGSRHITNENNLKKTEEYISGFLENIGLTVKQQQYKYGERNVTNIIAFSKTNQPTKYYVVGAHYDSVSETLGADDNASSIAVLLELARYTQHNKIPIPVCFIAFTLEEPPTFGTHYQGSRVFVKSALKKRDEILGAMILEMVGYTSKKQLYPLVLKWAGYPSEGNFIGIVGNRKSKNFCQPIFQSFKQNKQLPVETLFVPFNGWILPDTRLSDHSPFWDAGLPAVMITDTAFFRNPNYHTFHDTADTLDYVFMAELLKSLLITLKELS